MSIRKVPSRFRTPPLAILCACAALFASCDDTPSGPGRREVTFGGLFSLTGNWATLGRTGSAAMELAIEDANESFAGNPRGIRFTAAIEDTRLEPEVAVAKLETLRSRGVRILIGPQSSGEVERLRPLVDAGGEILISPSSTAGTLAIAGDNVFRFTPADSLEGVAVSALMWADGVRAIVPVWRDDAGNSGLERATRLAFGNLGGTVLSGVRYAADIDDFDAVAAAVRDQLEQAIATAGVDSVAVYLAAFDEVVGLFESAVADSLLRSVGWYGSDGVANSEALLGSAAGVEFAMATGYPNPVFGLDHAAREIWEPLSGRIRERTGIEPDAFAITVYDAVRVAARAVVATGAAASTAALADAVTAAAATHFGATGWTILDEYGDRRHGDFDFLAIREVNGVPTWTRVARYETRTGTISR